MIWRVHMPSEPTSDFEATRNLPLPFVFRVRYMITPFLASQQYPHLSGVHVYCRVFVAPFGGATFAACGNLTMREKEFEQFRRFFEREHVEFLDDAKA